MRPTLDNFLSILASVGFREVQPPHPNSCGWGDDVNEVFYSVQLHVKTDGCLPAADHLLCARDKPGDKDRASRQQNCEQARQIRHFKRSHLGLITSKLLNQPVDLVLTQFEDLRCGPGSVYFLWNGRGGLFCPI